MPCIIQYVQQPTVEDTLNRARNEALTQIEQELSLGTARLETDVLTGCTKIVGATVLPDGMADLCVLDALQQRGSLEWQLAAQHAGVQDKNFAQQHQRAHAEGHKH